LNLIHSQEHLFSADTQTQDLFEAEGYDNFTILKCHKQELSKYTWQKESFQ